jgi:RNA polymerase sigma-70 factor (ECF subfamily)
VALSDIDRSLLDACLEQQPSAWEVFVDRFTGLVFHVINHTAQSRSIVLSAADRDDLASEVMLAIVQDDFAVLRRFRGHSSLATYLTVIARRVVVRKLLNSHSASSLASATGRGIGSEHDSPGETMAEGAQAAQTDVESRISNHEEVERLLGQLDRSDAAVVRMYHLEGKSYLEISRVTGMPSGSVGPVLSRARIKLRGMPHV